MNPQNSYGINILEDAEAVARAAAEMVGERLAVAVSTQGFCSIALSGGSTPKRLFDLLANDPGLREKMPWQKTHFFWGDERHVPPDHPESNYRMAWQSMLSKAPVPPGNIHRVRGEDSDAEQAAADYERVLQAFFKTAYDQFPRFDLVLMGMGSDGHTASLFAGTAALEERRSWVVSSWVGAVAARRITMTVPVFNHAGLVIFLVSGAAKAETLKAVLASAEPRERFPARLIRPVNGELFWLLDQPAAALLSPTCRRGTE